MMRPMIAAALLLAAAHAAAQDADFVPLKSAQIATALTGQVLDYDGAWQDFRASGKTLYNAGRDSWGNWAVRGDQYCSQWPPNDLWACFDVSMRQGVDGSVHIRFVDAFSSDSTGVVRGE